MAESKQYITKKLENGQIFISEDVIATVALHTMSELECFAGLFSKLGTDIAELLRKNRAKGLKIVIGTDNAVSVDCNIMIHYGFNVVEAAKQIQSNVRTEVEAVAGVKVTAVNVNVCGIVRK